MADEAEPQRGDYGVRDAFLEDLRIARTMNQLRDASAYWALVEDLVATNSALAERVTALEAAVEDLNATLSTGQQ